MIDTKKGNSLNKVIIMTPMIRNNWEITLLTTDYTKSHCNTCYFSQGERKTCVPATSSCVLLRLDTVFNDNTRDLLQPFPCLGLELAPLTWRKMWACWEEARQQEESESHRSHPGGRGGKARHRQGWRQQAAAEQDSPQQAVVMPRGKTVRVQAGPCRWVGSAAKCFYRLILTPCGLGT